MVSIDTFKSLSTFLLPVPSINFSNIKRNFWEHRESNLGRWVRNKKTTFLPCSPPPPPKKKSIKLFSNKRHRGGPISQSTRAILCCNIHSQKKTQSNKFVLQEWKKKNSFLSKIAGRKKMFLAHKKQDLKFCCITDFIANRELERLSSLAVKQWLMDRSLTCLSKYNLNFEGMP